MITLLFMENSDIINSYEDREILYDIKLNLRLLRKRFNRFMKKMSKKIFTDILIVTAGEKPVDFIQAVKKQYPDKNFSLMVPVIGSVPDTASKTGADFEYFFQNKKYTAQLYKYALNENNIETYGIYSEPFSLSSDDINISNFKQLATFSKCVRYFAGKLNPEIIQLIDVPYFFGAEFEKKCRKTSKIYEIIRDFSRYENIEPFWACLNLSDKSDIIKLCKDKAIQKYTASLFKLKNINNLTQMYSCLDLIYANYTKFRSSIDSIEDIEENRIFKRLNARVLNIFPQISVEDNEFINPMYSSIKKCDFWSVFSETYYNRIFTEKELTGDLFNIIKDTKSKSSPVLFRADISKQRIYAEFNQENFREKRGENKKYLLKEFSKSRIKTNFTDSSLFADKQYKIYGYLEPFYDAPLIFCPLEPMINEYGIDIAFCTILKLFELNKNVQIILNIPNGMNKEYIRNFVDFCENKPELNGHWLFIDGKLNIQQFFASSDIALFPYRKNIASFFPLMSLNYGCIPVVSKIGFLNDLITDIYDDMENGCGFMVNYHNADLENAEIEFLKTSIKCINFYKQNSTGWNLIVKNALNTDVGWNFNVVEKINDIYDEII